VRREFVVERLIGPVQGSSVVVKGSALAVSEEL
jgi:hypothetical protein